VKQERKKHAVTTRKRKKKVVTLYFLSLKQKRKNTHIENKINKMRVKKK